MSVEKSLSSPPPPPSLPATQTNTHAVIDLTRLPDTIPKSFATQTQTTQNMNDNPMIIIEKQPLTLVSKSSHLIGWPLNFCLDNSNQLIIVDRGKHLIEVFSLNACFKLKFGEPGKQPGNLWFPYKVTKFPFCNKLVVCDRGINEPNANWNRIQIFNSDGRFINVIPTTFLAKSQMIVDVAVSNLNEIIVLTSQPSRIYRLNDNGDMLSYFEYSSSIQASGLAINNNEYFISNSNAAKINVISSLGSPRRSFKVSCIPKGIGFTNNNRLLLSSSFNRTFHAHLYELNGILIKEYFHQDRMIQDCMGLQISSDGRIVTSVKKSAINDILSFDY